MLDPDKLLPNRMLAGHVESLEELVDRFHGPMLRIAQQFLRDFASAEEIVQDTWIVVVQDLHKFNHTSTVKTWVFSILINKCKRRWSQDVRSLSFTEFAQREIDANEASVDPSRFFASGPGAHSWAIGPDPGWVNPEDTVILDEVTACIRGAIARLPGVQQAVITFRDVEGWGAAETCAVLGISEANQRVLLHRARAKVRTVVENHFAER